MKKIGILSISVFMICLCISAWQDFKTGETNLFLLLGSLFITSLLSFSHLRMMDALVVLAILMIPTLTGKMGWGDTIIFSHIALLFGWFDFFTIISTTAAGSLMWTLTRKTLKLNGQQEIRLIPFIAVATQITLIVKFAL